jgi:hypothetical protein
LDGFENRSAQDPAKKQRPERITACPFSTTEPNGTMKSNHAVNDAGASVPSSAMRNLVSLSIPKLEFPSSDIEEPPDSQYA